MTHLETMELLAKVRQLAELVGKLNEQANTARDAILLMRKIMALQDARIANLEMKLLGIKPQPPLKDI